MIKRLVTETALSASWQLKVLWQHVPPDAGPIVPLVPQVPTQHMQLLRHRVEYLSWWMCVQVCVLFYCFHSGWHCNLKQLHPATW